MMNQEQIEIILAALDEYAHLREAHFDGLPEALADAKAAREVMAALRQPPAAPQPDANGLLPCPFCGEEAEAHDYSTETDSWVVMCKGACNAEMHSRQSQQAAIHLWNRRAPQLQPLLCEQCNDYLEAPSYCEICYGTIESAFREADAKVAPQPPAPSAPLTDEVREAAAFALRCMDYQQPESGIKLKHKRTLRTWLAAQPSAPA